MKADFDIDYTEMMKEEKPHVLAYLVKSHIADNCSNHLKMFTDGSVLENEQGGAGFLIPEFKTGGKKRRSFYLGKGMSIFTAELFALLMALSYI